MLAIPYDRPTARRGRSNRGRLRRLALAMLLALPAGPVAAQVRVKDITDVQGVRDSSATASSSA
jgi:hypothetical protein